MITEASLTDHSVAARIHALTQAAYALEAGRIGASDFPPLRESLADLCQSPDRFLVSQESAAGSLIGALSFALDADAVTITRLVVSPTHLRQGIATALHADLERRLPLSVPCTVVSTAQANQPAVRLYQRLGYTVTGSSITPEGIPLFHFTKSREGKN